MKLQLVDNIGAHLKRYSVQALGLLVTLEACWRMIPEDVRAKMPEDIKDGAAVVIALAGLIGALLKQTDLKPTEFFSGR